MKFENFHGPFANSILYHGQQLASLSQACWDKSITTNKPSDQVNVLHNMAFQIYEVEYKDVA